MIKVPKSLAWGRFLQTPLSKAETKKILILESALNIVVSHGVKKLSISEISRATGMAKSLIIYHFKNTDEILLELFSVLGRQGQEFTLQALDGKMDLEEKVAAVIQGTFQWLLAHPQAANFFLIVYHLAGVNDEFYKINSHLLKTGLERFKTILSTSIKLKKNGNVEATAMSIQNLIIGTVVRMVSLKDYKHCNSYYKATLLGAGLLLNKNLPQNKL